MQFFFAILNTVIRNLSPKVSSPQTSTSHVTVTPFSRYSQWNSVYPEILIRSHCVILLIVLVFFTLVVSCKLLIVLFVNGPLPWLVRWL